MSAILEAIEKNPQKTKRLVGISYDQLKQLTAQAELLHNQKQEETERHKMRVNKKGGGNKPKLLPSEQILLTLLEDVWKYGGGCKSLRQACVTSIESLRCR